MVVSRAICQAKYRVLQVLIKQEEGDVATSKDHYFPKLNKAITMSRHNARGKICGAVDRLKIYGEKLLQPC
jgi:hypothetical protein